jgi:hypothetical protein
MQTQPTVVEVEPETVAMRIRRLQGEARDLSGAAAAAAITNAQCLCVDLDGLTGFDLLPEGERDAYKKLAAEIRSRIDSIRAIRGRR